jgi:hypothetical protein
LANFGWGRPLQGCETSLHTSTASMLSHTLVTEESWTILVNRAGSTCSTSTNPSRR